MLEGLHGGMQRWKRNGWRKSNNDPLMNTDLWKEMMLVWARVSAITVAGKVKAHSGVLGNENADKLAVLGMFLKKEMRGEKALRNAISAPYKRQLQNERDKVEQARKEDAAMRGWGETGRQSRITKKGLIPAHRRRLREKEEDLKEKTEKERESNRVRRKQKNKRRADQAQQDVKAFKNIAWWIQATAQERASVATCRTCGYQGHKSSGSDKGCPFAPKYRGRLPRRKHRKQHPEARRFAVQVVLPYLRRIKEVQETPKTVKHECRWCGKRYAGKRVLGRHDAVCPRGRGEERFGCRVPGCSKHYDTETQREGHEGRCTVYMCPTKGCKFVGRDKQDWQRHIQICTLELRCVCGEKFGNAIRDGTEWAVVKTDTGKRKYDARRELQKHKRVCKMMDKGRQKKELGDEHAVSVTEADTAVAIPEEEEEWDEWLDSEVEEDPDNEYAVAMGFAEWDEEHIKRDKRRKEVEVNSNGENQVRPPLTAMQKKRIERSRETESKKETEVKKVGQERKQSKDEQTISNMGWMTTSRPKQREREETTMEEETQPVHEVRVSSGESSDGEGEWTTNAWDNIGPQSKRGLLQTTGLLTSSVITPVLSILQQQYRRTWFAPEWLMQGIRSRVNMRRMNNDLREYDKFVVIVHHPTGIGHWTVVLGCFERKMIWHIDSLGMIRRNGTWVKMVKRFLHEEATLKEGVHINDFDEIINPEDTSRQRDAASCGVYALKWAEMHASGDIEIHNKIDHEEIIAYRTELRRKLEESWVFTKDSEDEILWCPNRRQRIDE